MGVYYATAKKRRKCRICGEVVTKGTPMLMNQYKAYPNSRWWTKDADCFRCVMNELEGAAPRLWELYAMDKVYEREGIIDAG